MGRNYLALIFFQFKQDIPCLSFPQTCKHGHSFIALIAQLLTLRTVHVHLKEKMGKSSCMPMYIHP